MNDINPKGKKKFYLRVGHPARTDGGSADDKAFLVFL